jgi:hypothetical protein
MAKLAILETKARYIGSTLEGEQATGDERFRAGQHGCDKAIWRLCPAGRTEQLSLTGLMRS